MRRLVALALAGWIATVSTAASQESVSTGFLTPRPPLVTTNARILASLERITKGSTLWRSEIDALRGIGRHVVVVTPDEVVVADPHAEGGYKPFEAGVLAEASPVVSGTAIRTVLVVVNLALLDRVHDGLGSVPGERDADLDRILVHEVYGHAFPYLRAGDLSGHCADPRPGERAAAACSIVRENAVREELGFGRRTDYGLNGLLLSRSAGPRMSHWPLSIR
jgi:hypothetical protein